MCRGTIIVFDVTRDVLGGTDVSVGVVYGGCVGDGVAGGHIIDRGGVVIECMVQFYCGGCNHCK